MKKIIIIIFLLPLLASSCHTQKKARHKSRIEKFKKASKTEGESININFEEVKIIDVGQYMDEEPYYFVIIGSFRSKENLENYKEQLKIDGFNVFTVLQNKAGLYRISVFHTNYGEEAQEKVMEIKKQYPQYADVWLLINKR